MTTPESNSTSVDPATPRLCLLCRRGFEPDLAEEVAQRSAVLGLATATAVVVEEGLIRVEGSGVGALAAAGDFVFERQRLPDAVCIGMGTLKPMARALAASVLPALWKTAAAWTVHAFASNPDGENDLTQRAGRLRDVFVERVSEGFPVLRRRYLEPPRAAGQTPLCVVQACLSPRALWACACDSARLSDPFPGGAHRLASDPLAPSRSHLKIEEAFDRMREEPRRGQTAVDLGAAPGGWTHALARRGCRVTAVDNGPLRLRSAGARGGTVRHLRMDGIGYRPDPEELPVDWLVSDMLVPAGDNLGMLRKWLDGRWMKRFVLNVKLPQERALAALRPLQEHLAARRGVRFRIRQLYHDRREVTVMGWVD